MRCRIALDFTANIETALPRHEGIEENHVNRSLIQNTKRLFSMGGSSDLESAVNQYVLKQRTVRRLVVDNQDRGRVLLVRCAVHDSMYRHNLRIETGQSEGGANLRLNAVGLEGDSAAHTAVNPGLVEVNEILAAETEVFSVWR
jgi:hypothetical protein